MGGIIIDDPHKAQDALSEMVIQKTQSYYKKAIATRANSRLTPIIVIMQRLHELDLAGFLLNKGTERIFERVVLRALKREDEPLPYDTRQPEEPLWPYMHDKASLQRMEKFNPFEAASQYDQEPSPFMGSIIRREWLQYHNYTPTSIIEGHRYKVISCDLTFKKESVSWIVYGIYVRVGPNIFLIDQIRGKWSFTESIDFLISTIKKHPDYSVILIEDKANGPAMVSALKNKVMGVLPVEVSNSKEERLSAVSPIYQSGNVFYPREENAPWVKEHEKEILFFPNWRHNDRVDAESMAIQHLAANKSGSFKGLY